ncbi:MAG: amidohydrolase family protein [Candidatus Obscuribacterales bacterium]|nr:amidohydrolase family protein [Candidatus Obscuribacterales bacterium]
MHKGLYTIDFHTHLQDADSQLDCLAEDRSSLKSIEPLFDQIASLSEPVHDALIRHWALNYRDNLSRFLYARFGKLGLMEVLRLLRTYDIKKLLASMNRVGIDHCVIHSIEPLSSTKAILEITRPHRDRISVFASVDKAKADPVAYLRPLIESGTVVGIKFHPIVGRFECGEIMLAFSEVVELAQEADIPVMIHTGHIPTGKLKAVGGCNEVQALEPLVRKYPRVRFVLAHIGWESWRQVIDLAQRHDNTYVETSWQPARIIRRAVDKLGSTRVLFGSDFPLFKQSIALGNCREALTEREFVDVVSVNSRRLLNLANPQPATSEHKAFDCPEF